MLLLDVTTFQNLQKSLMKPVDQTQLQFCIYAKESLKIYITRSNEPPKLLLESIRITI